MLPVSALFAIAAVAGAPSGPRSEDVASMDAIVAALYDVISGPAGQPRDWDRMRALFAPGARLIPTVYRADSVPSLRVWDVEQYIAAVGPRLESGGFFEREIARRTERYGGVVHLFSTYESRRASADPAPFARGINSIQLWFDGRRWWIVSIFWESERPNSPIPPGYLKTPGDQQFGGPPPFGPPGRLVDIGGWRLHLICTGQSRPRQATVILEAGAGDFSVEWSLVQPGVAGFARVCSYDRGGDGWSELGPHPRTMHQIVYELHALLDKAGEHAPFVLVGHSYGGWLVRLYQETWPADVAGLILVEGGADNPWRMTQDGKLVRAADLATGKPIAPVQTANPLREADIPPGAMSQIKAGLADAVLHANDPPRDKLPPAAQQMRTWALGTVKHVAAAVNPFDIEELAELAAQSAKIEHPLGDLPLVVFTRGRPEEDGPDAKAREEEHRKDHVRLATLSRDGKLIVAEKSGHHVQLQEPELVVNAIREMVTATRN